MPEKIVETRIIPQNINSSIVSRQRLLSILKDNIDKSLILVCASAGFGKTTLVQDFVSAGKLNYAWYYVTSDINSFHSFFTYIIYSLKRLSGDFGDNTLSIIDTIKRDSSISKDFKRSIDDISATFLNEFCNCFKDDITLVLDDLHNIDSQECGEWLNYLINVLFDNLPPNLHVIITTREIPDFNIIRLKAKRRVLMLKTEDMVFDKQEIIELLENIYALDYTKEDIKILQSNFSGWITGIHLILQAFGKNFRKVNISELINHEEIFNYFANEIFKNMGERTKEFLLSTALLENFDYLICDHLLNIQYSKQIISELLQKNIFIQQAIISHVNKSDIITSVSYNYQELFRLFLFSKMHELKTEKEINFQLRQLFEYYLQRNEFVTSVNYGLKAKAYSEVIPIIIKNFKFLFEKGYFELLWKWVSSIPNEMVDNNASLLYYLGLLHLYFHSEPEKSIFYLEPALTLADKNKDISLIIDCWLSKTDALLLTGGTDKLNKELSNLLNLKISLEERARILFAISRVLYRQGPSKYTENIELLTETLKICNEENLLSLKTDVLRMLGNIYSDWGDLYKAIHFHEQSVGIDTDVYKLSRAMNNIIEEYCVFGNYVKAKEYLDKVTELYNTFPSLFFKRYLLRSKGAFSFECGDFEECIRNYLELNELELKSSIKYYSMNSYIYIGEANYYLKKYDSAVKNFDIAENNIEESNDYHKLIILYLKTKLSLKVKPEADAEKILLEALNYHEKNNILQQKAQIEFHLADFYLKSGMAESAVKYLKDCLSVSSHKQLVSFLEQETLNSRSVFDFAVSHPELSAYKKFIRTLFENVKERFEFNWLSDEYRKRLTQQINELNDIRMTSFGNLEFRLRGELIPEAQWTRKKSKLILAYLLAKPERILTKDKLIDKFFQDIPAANIDAIYHNTISNIRTALKINYNFENKPGKKIKKSKKSPDNWEPTLILYEDKTLRLNTDFYFTSDCAEFEKLYNSAMSSEVKMNQKINYCKQAAHLYKGDFLPGNYDPWCEESRQNYSNMFIKLCSILILALKEKKDYTEVIKYAEKLLKVDKLNDEAYIIMIEALAKLGEINIARDKFALMLKAYDEEIGEKPDKAIMEKIKNILI